MRSDYVFPLFSAHDSGNNPLTNAIICGEFDLCARSIGRAYFTHLFLCQLGRPLPLSARRPISLHHVRRVVGMCSINNVVRIHASLHVTGMPRHLRWPSSVKKVERNAVGIVGFPLKPNASIRRDLAPNGKWPNNAEGVARGVYGFDKPRKVRRLSRHRCSLRTSVLSRVRFHERLGSPSLVQGSSL